MAGCSYWANTCEHCSAVQGDDERCIVSARKAHQSVDLTWLLAALKKLEFSCAFPPSDAEQARTSSTSRWGRCRPPCAETRDARRWP